MIVNADDGKYHGGRYNQNAGMSKWKTTWIRKKSKKSIQSKFESRDWFNIIHENVLFHFIFKLDSESFNFQWYLNFDQCS